MNLSSSLRLDTTNPILAPKKAFNGRSCYGNSGPHFTLHHRNSSIIVCSVKPVASSSSASVVAKTSTDVPSRIEALSQVSGVLGCQWGDEGKGKLVDILAKHFDIVARCQVLFILFIYQFHHSIWTGNINNFTIFPLHIYINDFEKIRGTIEFFLN